MIALVFAVILLIIGVVGGVIFGFNNKLAGLAIGVVCSLFAGLCLLISSYHTVDEGNNALLIQFGEVKADVGPGTHWAAPWTKWVTIPAREQLIEFSGDEPEREAQGLDDLTMQTAGGGSYDLDATVRYQIPREAVQTVYSQLGSGYHQRIAGTSRSCIRDSGVGFEFTEAVTSKRAEGAELSRECLQAQFDSFGIEIVAVEFRGTDFPETIKAAMDAKQAAEQSRQEAETNLEKREIEARARAVDALGKANASRIESCGGKTKDDGTIVPNEVCVDQFSPGYIELQRIQALKEVDQLIAGDGLFNGGGLILQQPAS